MGDDYLQACVLTSASGRIHQEAAMQQNWSRKHTVFANRITTVNSQQCTCNITVCLHTFLLIILFAVTLLGSDFFWLLELLNFSKQKKKETHRQVYFGSSPVEINVDRNGQRDGQCGARALLVVS